MKIVQNAIEALASIRPGQRVFIQGAAATPDRLVQGLAESAVAIRKRNADLGQFVEIVHLHTDGLAEYAAAQYKSVFRVSSLFCGANLRKQFNPGHVDFIPCFLSEIPILFRSGDFPIDVALIQVSPPDAHGYCTLGTSVDVARSAVDVASTIIAQVNPQMPRVHGDGFIHVDEIDFAIEVNQPLMEHPQGKTTAEEIQIAHWVSQLIEDGSTLQMGIGSIPNAVLGSLGDRKNLGVHTEMFSDGLIPLIQSGVVNNSKKKIHRGKTVAGFVSGSKVLYQFVHDNPTTVLLDIAYVNNPAVIARNPRVVAINSAVEVDLTGQVCADSVGSRVISGAGGQVDYMRGAAASAGGKPIIAMTSRTHRGESRIVSTLKSGAGVVTTRSNVHWIVTEYGAVNLFGKNLEQRATALIKIAHPEDRDQLTLQWRALFS